MKVRQDKHGVYVRTDGCVYRPVKTDYTYAYMYPGMETPIPAGEEVKAHHMTSTPMAKIRWNGREVYWSDHGCYFNHDGSQIPTESLWMPTKFRPITEEQQEEFVRFLRSKGMHVVEEVIDVSSRT